MITQLAQLAQSNKGQPTRIILGVAGIPGSGKTTLAQQINQQINALCGEELSVVLPMDGFHLLRHSLQFRHSNNTNNNNTNPPEQTPTTTYTPSVYNTIQRNFPAELIHTPYQQALRTAEEQRQDDDLYFIDEQYQPWPNSHLAFQKRGAMWTFDPYLLSYALHNIKYRDDTTQFFPGWDHAKKDPSYDQPIVVHPHISLVIVEGLYLLLNLEPWYSLLHTNKHHAHFRAQNVAYKKQQEQQDYVYNKINPMESNGLIDIGVVLECDEETTTMRGAVRNWKSGITETLEESIVRWKDNDIVNGRLLLKYMLPREVVSENGPQQWYTFGQQETTPSSSSTSDQDHQ